MNETARLLDDSTDRLLRDHLSDPLRRRSPGLRAALLAEIAEAGLSLALAPAEDGGLGATLSEAAVIAWRWGFHAAPLPIVEILLAGLLPAQVRERICDGDLALAETRIGPSSARLAGACAGHAPAGLLAVAAAPSGNTMSEYPVSAGDIRHALSGEVQVLLTGSPDPVSAAGVALDAHRFAVAGALLTAAAMSGAMGRALEIASEHANTRAQFGKPLAKFQAIQHMLAEAASEHLLAQAALARALSDFDEAAPHALSWRAAKAQAGHAATKVAAVAHQVLGAIGFTDEHDLHFYTTRLWSWRDEWGRQAVCEAQAGRDATADPRGLWQHMVDSEEMIR